MNGLRRISVATGTALLACAAALTPAPALAAGATTAVTVFLKAPNLPALQQLANARGLTHAQRVKALTALLPSAADRATATKALKADGLKVANQTAWSISATAASSTVAATFGAHPAMRAHATAAERTAAAGPYPTIPANLDGVASAAYPTTGGPAVFHHATSVCDCLIGTDFRNAYTSPALTAAAQPPYSGAGSATPLTIATLQLAGWNPNDLTNFASTPNIGVPGFNAATTLTTVPVYPLSSVPGPSASDDGDTEVDLDQEALLSTDPYAHQRPYFAPNTAAGYANAFNQVLDDVIQDSDAYQGGDPRIAALSISWGECELDTGGAYVDQVLEPILSSLVAAGVTVFSSSGDAGIYDDCESSPTNVDYPASSPEVVGVGGTTLNAIGSSAPNTGANWAESAWSCTTTSDCTANGGSGGGVSALFSKPPFQNAVADPPFSTETQRMVPDISANADPNTGFPIYTTDPTDTLKFDSNYLIIGGTSLAAPVSAALFTNVLAAHGATSGIGDIHHALYQAYAAHSGAFRDVTAGSNGTAADDPNNPSVNAATGYDTVSGLGSPLWPAIGSFLFAPTTPPTVTAQMSLVHPHSSTAPRTITASWNGVAASGGNAVQDVVVSIRRAGQAAPVFPTNNVPQPAIGSKTFTGAPGATYILTATAADITGETSTLATQTVSVPVDDRQFSKTGTWKHVSGASDIAGSAAETSHRGATATVTSTGKSYTVVVKTGPGFGEMKIAKGFSNLRTVNLYSAHAGTKTVTLFSATSTASRTFRFTCIGKKSSKSTGTKVGIDGMTVLY